MSDKIEITFKNEVSEQTHIFEKKHLKQEGFFAGLLTNSMKEAITDKATILFSKEHPVSFVFMDNLFANLELLFARGNLSAMPFSGQFIYQIDKLLDYFLCSKYKEQIFAIIDNLLPSDRSNSDLDLTLDDNDNEEAVVVAATTTDMVYVILTLYDNKGFQLTKNWLVEWFRGLTKSLDTFFPLFRELMKTVNESDFYTTQQTVQMMQLMNVIRNNISAEMLQDQRLSDVLLMHPSDVDEYLVYEKPPPDMALYFPPPEMVTYTPGQKMLLSADEAKLRFTLISQGKLQKMPWRNVIVAGGSANLMLDATLDPGNFPASDIDLFVYGQTKEIRQEVVEGLLAYFDGLPTGRKFYVVKQSVVSIYIDDCPTSFQIIAGNAATILDVLHHFDLDHLRMAYKNGEFYMTLEAVEALKIKTSYVHGYGTNIYRIWKTVNRGYNLVDNGDLILNTDRVEFLTAIDQIPPNTMHRHQSLTTNKKADLSVPKKLDLKTLMAKFALDKYKYYVPRKEETAEKILYEIHLHTRSKPNQIVRTIDLVKARMELEGNFKTQVGNNGYMGSMLDIRADNIVLKHASRGSSLQYLSIAYKHRDNLGLREKYITYRTPICYLRPSSNNRDLNLIENPSNWTMDVENKDFLKFVQMQSEMIMTKVASEPHFKQWCDKLMTRAGISVVMLPKIELTDGTLRVKIRPHNLNIILSNGTRLNDSQRALSHPEAFTNRKIKCDIYIDKLCYDFNKTEYFFVYNIKTIRLMEGIDPDLYPKAPATGGPTLDDDGDEIERSVDE